MVDSLWNAMSSVPTIPYQSVRQQPISVRPTWSADLGPHHFIFDDISIQEPKNAIYDMWDQNMVRFSLTEKG
jgi:hypothetical protein